MNRPSFLRILLDPKPTDGNGDNNPSVDDDELISQESKLDARKLLLRHKNNAEKAMSVLLADNYKLRERDRRREEEWKAKLPPEGAVVLQGDQAEAWKQYQELGPAKDLAKSLEDGREAATKAKRYEQQAHRGKVADLLDWDAEVLGTLLDRDGIDPVIEEAKGKDGKAVPAALVVTRGNDGKEQKVPLAEYAETHWMGKYGDSLRKRKVAHGGTPPSRIAHQPPPERDEDVRAKVREDNLRANRGYHTF
jgi:hypothetical protein